MLADVLGGGGVGESKYRFPECFLCVTAVAMWWSVAMKICGARQWLLDSL